MATMATSDNRGLLPAGLRDVLAPDAAHEAAIVERLLGSFARWGYRRVKPPLVEFEASLLEGAGAAMAGETFRLMDPVSQAMMGVRADMTLQIARIAASRLAAEARPLRLSYAGDVLRVRGTQLRPERQFVQVGGELIGAAGPAADTEVILMAVRALRGIGLDRLSVDLTFPTLIATLSRFLGIAGDREAAMRAGARQQGPAGPRRGAGRDAESRAIFLALLDATGPAGPGLALLEATGMPAEARADVDHLADVAARLGAAAPDLALTVDPVEYRGFEYHTGIGFTVYRNGSRGEIGAGGRYLAGPVLPTGPSNRRPASRFSSIPSSAACRRRKSRPACSHPAGRRRKPSTPCAGRAAPSSRASNRPATSTRRPGGSVAMRFSKTAPRAPSRPADPRRTRRSREADHGQRGGRRQPVGRRGQGQDRRLALRARRCRRALPGRAQCRPHAGDRRRHLQAEPAASGIVRPGKLSLLGNGVVIDPWALLEEIDTVTAQGVAVDPDRLRIAENAALILPLHRELDNLREAASGSGRIGTTGRGIGPAYEDKVGRRAVRAGDLAHPDVLRSRIGRVCSTTTRCAPAWPRRRSTATRCSTA